MTNTCRFVWHDLSTSDVEAAERFYGELFDWRFDASANEPYHHIQAGERMIGGVRRKDPGEPGPPSWLGYILVDDVPTAIEQVTASAGKVYVPTTTMPDVGTFAVVADPSGGVVAPWRSARPDENEGMDELPATHTFCWDELLTTDPAAAIGFYTSVFGWETETQDMGALGEYTLFNRPGVPNPMRDGTPARAGGLMKSPPSVPFSFWLAYVLVEDTDATSERARGLGANIIVPPTDIPDIGRFSTFLDPEGAPLACISLPV